MKLLIIYFIILLSRSNINGNICKEIESKNLDKIYKMGITCLYQENYKIAKKYIDKVYSEKKDLKSLILLLKVEQYYKNYQSILDKSDKYLKKNGNTTYIIYEIRSFAAFNLKKWDLSYKEATKCLEVDNYSTQCWKLKGVSLIQMDKKNKALSILKKGYRTTKDKEIKKIIDLYEDRWGARVIPLFGKINYDGKNKKDNFIFFGAYPQIYYKNYQLDLGYYRSILTLKEGKDKAQQEIDLGLRYKYNGQYILHFKHIYLDNYSRDDGYIFYTKAAPKFFNIFQLNLSFALSLYGKKKVYQFNILPYIITKYISFGLGGGYKYGSFEDMINSFYLESIIKLKLLKLIKLNFHIFYNSHTELVSSSGYSVDWIDDDYIWKFNISIPLLIKNIQLIPFYKLYYISIEGEDSLSSKSLYGLQFGYIW